MKTVEVFLSTYNGEKYLREQIESILQQKNVVISILIRDDGSSDGTIEILKHYEKYPNISVLYGENIGYQRSFLSLMSLSKRKSDYYAFSDQDDIWESEKMLQAINEIQTRTINSPLVLYFSSLKVVDEKLNFKFKKDFIDRKRTLGSVLSSSNIAGCTFVFNSELISTVLQCNEIFNIPIGHDSWLYKIAVANSADIVYDINSYILFRRHSTTTSNLNKNIVERLKKDLYAIFFNDNRNSKVAKAINNTYYDSLKTQERLLLNKLIAYDSNFKNRIALLFINELKTGSRKIDFVTKFKILIGVY
ncbi:TPA: glycosyltransferase [Streptococcus suis]